MTAKQEAGLQSEAVLKDMAEQFRKTAPNSSFMRLYDLVVPDRAKPGNSVPMPPCLPDLVNELDNNDMETMVENLLLLMDLNKEQRSQITRETKEQSFSDEWKKQKVGRITASHSKRCYTRAKTLMIKPEEDHTAVISEVMQYNAVPCNAAIKHGLSMEPRAKLAFGQIMKDLKHKKFTTSEVGLIIHETDPYIGASPDLLVSCSCHGEGVCEIKCPLLYDKLTAENYTHIEECEGKLKLKHSSPYYYQIQHQLGVTGRKHAYFFAYTSKDYVLDEIKFDLSLWLDMLEKFTYLWRKYVAPELLLGTIFSKRNQNQVHEHDYSSKNEQSVHCAQDKKTVLQADQTPKARPKHYLTKSHFPDQYLCSYCGEHLPDEPDDQSGASIECTDCESWWHFACLDATPMETSGSWFCPNCSAL